MQRERTVRRPRHDRTASAMLVCFIAAALSAGPAAARGATSALRASAPPSVVPDLLVTPPDPNELRFGACLAGNGDALAIAAPTEGDLGNKPGRVDVLRISIDDECRPRVATLTTLIGAGGGDHFGSSLALTTDPVSRGRLLLVGADGASLDPDGSGGFEGAVHLYESRRDDPILVHRATMHATTPEPGSAFGHAVAWHPCADSFAVGAHRHDHMELPDAGSVTVFSRTSRAGNSRWTPTQELRAPSPRMSEWFGTAVAMGVSQGGDWLAIGAPGRDLSPEVRGAGAVFLFKRSTSGAYELARMLTSPQPHRFAWFGASVDIDHGRLAIGEPRGCAAASESAPRSGAAWIFALDAPEAPAIALSPWPAQDGAGFGQSVAMSHDLVVVGAPGFDLWPTDSAEPIEDIGRAFAFTTAGTPLHALETTAQHPSALFAPTAAILDIGHMRVAALGHLYTEEESSVPSAGVALFTTASTGQPASADPEPPAPTPRTTWPGSAASRRHARSR